MPCNNGPINRTCSQQLWLYILVGNTVTPTDVKLFFKTQNDNTVQRSKLTQATGKNSSGFY